jgi:hypothetical protein
LWLKDLKEHEEIKPVYLEKLREQIRKDGILKKPIIVDKGTRIILDGHHRYRSLKELGCSKIPAILVDYTSSEIIVIPWRDNDIVTKEDVKKAGLTGKKLPPKTSRHMILSKKNKIHISKISEKIEISLKELN